MEAAECTVRLNPHKPLDFIGIKSHPLLGRGKSCNSCTDAEHCEGFKPLFPAVLREWLCKNIGCHLIGVAVLHFADTKFIGDVMQPPQADIMAPLQVPHGRRMAGLPSRNTGLVVLLKDTVNSTFTDGVKNIHNRDTNCSQSTKR